MAKSKLPIIYICSTCGAPFVSDAAAERHLVEYPTHRRVSTVVKENKADEHQ